MKTLIKEKDYLHNIIKSMMDCLIVIDPVGNIKMVNQSTLEVLGYKEEELLNQFIGKIFAEEEEEEEEWFRRSGIADLMETGYIKNVEKSYMTKDGRKIPVLFSGSVMRGDDGKVQGIVCIANDMTEYKKMGDEINSLAKFPNENPYPVLRISKDGVILYANTASLPVLKVWNCKTGQLLPDALRQLFINILESGWKDEIDVLCGKVLFSLTLTPIVDSGYVNVYGHDVTERELKKAELIESEERYRTLVETIPDIVYRVDERGNFTFVNSSVRNLGYEPEELIGKHFATILQGDVEAISRSAILLKYKGKVTGGENAPKLFDEKRSGKRITRNLEVRLAPKNHEKMKSNGVGIVGLITAFGEVAASGSYANNKNKSSDFFGTVGVIRDITEKIEFQEEVIRAGQLAVLGELSACVAHEINNPVNGVINCAQLLLDGSDAKNIDLNLVNKIIKECDRISNVVSSLLSFSRKEGEDTSCFSINELLSDTLVLAGAHMKNDGININISIAQDVPVINGYSQKIQQVFLNILNNSRFALNEKYPDRHEDKIIEITGKSIMINDAPCIQVVFYDQGQGIPADKLDHVMNSFFTTKPAGKGTGLGLSISSRIIKDHGGNMEIESAEGEYTRVIINLPVNKEVND